MVEKGTDVTEDEDEANVINSWVRVVVLFLRMDCMVNASRAPQYNVPEVEMTSDVIFTNNVTDVFVRSMDDIDWT